MNFCSNKQLILSLLINQIYFNEWVWSFFLTFQGLICPPKRFLIFTRSFSNYSAEHTHLRSSCFFIFLCLRFSSAFANFFSPMPSAWRTSGESADADQKFTSWMADCWVSFAGLELWNCSFYTQKKITEKKHHTPQVIHIQKNFCRFSTKSFDYEVNNFQLS